MSMTKAQRHATKEHRRAEQPHLERSPSPDVKVVALMCDLHKLLVGELEEFLEEKSLVTLKTT